MCFLRTSKFCMCFLKSQVFQKTCYLRKYAVVGCKSMDTFGCMFMPFGCMYAAGLGACMRLLGASLRRRLGAKYAVVGCKFHNG